MPDALRWFVPVDRLRALVKDLPGEWLIGPTPTGDLTLAVLERGGIRHTGVVDLHENVVKYFPPGSAKD